MNRSRILVVEDETIVALDIKRRLETMGYIVCGMAATGEQAIALAASAMPDLILMDIKLKGKMDGIEAAEKIRSSRNLPIIFITAFADDVTLERARVTQAFGYVLKPFEERELVMNIEIAVYKHQMEKALQAREEHFRELVENATDIILVLSDDGTILYGSPSLERSLGYNSSDYLGHSCINFCHPDDHDVVKVDISTLSGSPGKRITLEHRLRTKDGVWRNFETTGRALCDVSGIVTLVINSHDITERKRAEDAERQQRLLADALRETGAVLNSSLDLDIVLDRLLEQIGQVVPYDSGCVLLADNGTAKIVRMRGYEKFGVDPAKVIRKMNYNLKEIGSFRSMVETGQPFIVQDTRSDPGWQMHETSAHIRSCVGAPIISQGELIGFLSLDKTEPGFYRAEHAERMAIFASQAALALQNAHLFEAARRHAEENQLLREAASVVASALELDKVLEHILTQLERVIPYDSAAVFLTENGSMRVVAGRGFPNLTEIIGSLLPEGDELVEDAKRTSAPLYIPDVREDPRYKSWGETRYTRGWLGVPLLVRGNIIGFLTLDSKEIDAYDDAEISLAWAFANQAAIAIDNAHLFDQVHKLAITDTLTRIFNRRHFFDLSTREFERARRFVRPVSLVMWDIDHFKAVNDTYGHIAGDHVLQSVAERCRRNLREIDILGRYGGEEFVALIAEANSASACEVAERLRMAVASPPYTYEGKEISITISVGVADNAGCPSLEALLEHADQALYRAKQQGRNRVSL